MTETTTAAPPPPPPPPPPSAVPLVRPRDGRVFRGVCAALGRSTQTDPVLWRVLIAVLAVFGGSGIVLYLAGWLLIPEEGADRSAGQRLLGGDRNRLATVVLVVAGVLALLVVVDGDGSALVPLVVIGGIAYLVLRERQGATTPTAGWTAPPAWEAAPYATAPVFGPPPAPVPPAPRSNLGGLTLSVAVLVVGLLLLAGAAGADGITAPRVVAAALLVVGAGLLVGARWGRARWLVAVALVLGLALAATSSADRDFGSSAGERTWTPTGSAAYRLGAGEAVLDLGELAGTARTVDIEARVGMGQLTVLVPEDLRVDVRTQAGLGELAFVDPDGDVRTVDGANVERSEELGPPGPRRVELDVRVGLGELEVRRVAAQ